VILNAYWEPLEFELPPPPEGSPNGWQRIVDTYRESPDDFCERADAPPVEALAYRVQPRSVVVLVADHGQEA
jgi:glycogen operon protein